MTSSNGCPFLTPISSYSIGASRTTVLVQVHFDTMYVNSTTKRVVIVNHSVLTCTSHVTLSSKAVGVSGINRLMMDTDFLFLVFFSSLGLVFLSICAISSSSTVESNVIVLQQGYYSCFPRFQDYLPLAFHMYTKQSPLRVSTHSLIESLRLPGRKKLNSQKILRYCQLFLLFYSYFKNYLRKNGGNILHKLKLPFNLDY